MASKKKQSEGIALLSVYNDEEDEDMEDAEENEEADEREEDLENFDRVPSDYVQETTTSYFFQSQNSFITEDSTPKEDKVFTPAPQPQFSLSSPPPPQLLPPALPPLPPPTFDAPRTKRRSLGIVDYGHDDTAMSPEAEEGEIMDTGHVMFGEDLQTGNGNFQGITPPGSAQITPNTEGTPPPPELMQSDDGTTMCSVYIESETIVVEETVRVCVEMQKDVNPLDNFLPPPPKSKCSEELQEKINKFLALKRAGKSFNAEVRNRKDYRNPDFLVHAVRYQDIDQIGSCFSKDVFDPHGYDKSDFYDALEGDMKVEMERKEQEKKKSQKLDFVGGGTQVGATQRSNIQIPAGFHSHPVVPGDSMGRESSRQNKKSKWDKGDGDKKQEALSTAAAILCAANVGAGYNAFAQQKRREAEGRRSSEKRRS